MPRGGAGRGQGRKHVLGKMRPYAKREAIGKTSFRIGMRCVELRREKPSRSREGIIEQVAKESGRSADKVTRCWKWVSSMLKDLREDSPVEEYEPDTRPRLDGPDDAYYSDSISPEQQSKN
jgi:hypothetical protein